MVERFTEWSTPNVHSTTRMFLSKPVGTARGCGKFDSKRKVPMAVGNRKGIPDLRAEARTFGLADGLLLVARGCARIALRRNERLNN